MSAYERKYTYTVRKENSPSAFKAACRQIEDSVPHLEKYDLLVDVDGSTIQVYRDGKDEITVIDDYDVGVVFVGSDVDLNEIFGNIE